MKQKNYIKMTTQTKIIYGAIAVAGIIGIYFLSKKLMKKDEPILSTPTGQTASITPTQNPTTEQVKQVAGGRGH